MDSLRDKLDALNARRRRIAAHRASERRPIAPNTEISDSATAEVLPGCEASTPFGPCWSRTYAAGDLWPHFQPLTQTPTPRAPVANRQPRPDEALLFDAHAQPERVATIARCELRRADDIERALDALPTVSHSTAVHATSMQAERLDGLADGVIIDLETGGLAGSPIFLAGALALDLRPLRVEQWLVRDYPEEPAVLAAFADRFRDRAVWLSFNGRSFDEPMLRDRAQRWGVEIPRPQRHVDLLHAARRRWRRELADCRLQTLETAVLRQQRTQDIPGADAPDLFHHFVKTRRANLIRGVCLHNALDLLSCAALLTCLALDRDSKTRS